MKKFLSALLLLTQFAHADFTTTKRIVDADIVQGQKYTENFIKNSPPKAGVTRGWSCYADAAASRPVDGTGGSPAVTWTATSTGPIRGPGAFVFTKDAVNRQGQGCAYTFSVDQTDRAKVLNIEAEYLVGSGTFTAGTPSSDSDVIVYIFDVTNSQLIEPSSIKLLSNSITLSDKFQASFQTSATGTQYRLIFHTATTSASAFSLKFGDIAVHRSNYVYGTPITDWQPYTPIYIGLGTVSTDESFWRRVGDSVELRGRASLGTTTGATASISFPNGISASTSKALITTLYGQFVNQNDTTNTFNIVVAPGATAFNMSRLSAGSLSTVVGTQVGATGNAIAWFTKPIPIQGWSSSVQMSDQADTRVVSFNAYKSGGNQNGSSGVVSFTSAKDTHGAFNLSSGAYTIPVAGDYTFGYNIEWSAAQGVAFTFRVNGSVIAPYGASSASSVYNSHTYMIKDLKIGDVITVSSATGAVLSLVDFYFWGQRVSGPSAIAASEKVSFSYGVTTGLSLSAATHTTVAANIKSYDSHNIYNTSTGKWKLPKAGTGSVGARFLTNNLAAGTTIYYAEVRVLKNGSVYKLISGHYNPGAGTTTYPIGWGKIDIQGIAGDEFEVQAYYSVATSIFADVTQSYIDFSMD